MTSFDSRTANYLERLGVAPEPAGWDSVLERARDRERRARVLRLAIGAAAAGAVAAAVLAVSGAIGGLGGPSIVEKAEAAVLHAVEPAEGTIEHILVEYRDDSRQPFNVYETWLAADGSWCRRTVEGTPEETVTRLTQCRAADGLIELYLPSTNEILRTRKSPTPAGNAIDTSEVTIRKTKDGIVLERDGVPLTPDEVEAFEAAVIEESIDPGPAPDWLTEDVIEAFRKDAVHEAGTMELAGNEYTKLMTENGDIVLVDPETGESVAWIPTPAAFGIPTTVVRTRETLPDNEQTRRLLSLAALHPDAAARDVSPVELMEAVGSQYPNG